MIDSQSTTRWLADQIDADWLHLQASEDGPVGSSFLVTVRFDKDYCQAQFSFDQLHPWSINRMFVKHLSQMRDEFFLLKMHHIDRDEGVKIEKGS